MSQERGAAGNLQSRFLASEPRLERTSVLGKSFAVSFHLIVKSARVLGAVRIHFISTGTF